MIPPIHREMLAVTIPIWRYSISNDRWSRTIAHPSPTTKSNFGAKLKAGSSRRVRRSPPMAKSFLPAPWASCGLVRRTNSTRSPSLPATTPYSWIDRSSSSGRMFGNVSIAVRRSPTADSSSRIATSSMRKNPLGSSSVPPL